MRRFALSIILAASLGMAASCTASSEAEARLEGAWRLVEARTLPPEGGERPYSTQESLLLFTDTHYSMAWAGGEEPSPYYAERFAPTEEEKLQRYDRLLINSGTYQASGSNLVIKPLFALVPEFVGGRGEFEYSLSGDELRLTWKVIESADGVPDPYTAAGYRWKYLFKRQPRSP